MCVRQRAGERVCMYMHIHTCIYTCTYIKPTIRDELMSGDVVVSKSGPTIDEVNLVIRRNLLLTLSRKLLFSALIITIDNISIGIISLNMY